MTDLHGEFMVTEVHSLLEAESVANGQGFISESTILSDTFYVFLPVTAIVSPAVKVQAKERPLWCEKCKAVKTFTIRHEWAGWEYVCECGERIEYIVVTKDGKL